MVAALLYSSREASHTDIRVRPPTADNVAVKLVKEGMAAREDLLGEAALMALLDDTNIVRLVGVVTVPRDMVRSVHPFLPRPMYHVARPQSTLIRTGLRVVEPS